MEGETSEMEKKEKEVGISDTAGWGVADYEVGN